MSIESLTEEFNRIDELDESQREWVMQDMTFVLFGATGDLAQRKLFPALYNLYLDNKLPDTISIVGLGRRNYTDGVFQEKIEKSLHTYSRKAVQSATLQEFLEKFRYCIFDATETEAYQQLDELIEKRENELGIPQNRLFYLSVAPGLIDGIASNLHATGVSKSSGWNRLIVEKPFGRDLETARTLNHNLGKVFKEEEIYRIDHYLGKPMVQNLKTLVMANPVLGSLLNHHQISNVQITASETVGIEDRAGYYDKAGAIRDMVQNHLLQLVMMTAVHLPDNLMVNTSRVNKTEIIESLQPIVKEQAHQNIIRGQYESGEIQDSPAAGYREEEGVADLSKNDTYVAARIAIDHPSWRGIPFYIRTGKRMNEKSTQIVIEFENRAMDSEMLKGAAPNLVMVEISPNESISLRVNLKDAASNQFKPVWTNLSTNSEDQPEAYELLLYDALRGNSTFFANWREVELSWEWIQPVLEAFQEDLLPLHFYPAGSKGPRAANELLMADGYKWW
ncbi:glucose-6-phosphate 1-dehydrogenase [Planomicrobium stackebrandtii]|uniref:Glucose-6-phosphate 1-dehydrogenase n=1 Tax=Planomicrobium stackebrandtii TaxID=253160 RepID=A0ABU0GY69_9BACL|nr:glucose-6-phosphate dehydrogenase [Planomicrobium stackebrandtii]MDQ0429487.1 glucose-6-phosphate 1-dehydrogenase [Planomicrobium stackebrandtii]